MSKGKRNTSSNATSTPTESKSTAIETQGSTRLRYEDLPAFIRADIENTVKMRLAAGLSDDSEERKKNAVAYFNRRAR